MEIWGEGNGQAFESRVAGCHAEGAAGGEYVGLQVRGTF